MAAFGVRIVEIDRIEEHPNADAIEIATIGRFRSVVAKSEKFKQGQRVVYIPEASVLPQFLMERLGLWNEEQNVGKLGGPNNDRVSAIKLRGVFSQGICMPIYSADGESYVIETEDDMGSFYGLAGLGDDVSDLLRIRKFVPTVPDCLLGDVFPVGQSLAVDFDVEDIKGHPAVFTVGEEVVFTEKLHGVFTGVGILPAVDAADLPAGAFGKDRNILLYSKGLGAQGMAFADVPDNADSMYVRSTASLRARIDELGLVRDEPFAIMGETFGPGVQDLHYGSKIAFRMFAACVGYRGDQRYLDDAELTELAALLHIERVPELYRGPFSWEALAGHTDGRTAMGDGKHIREGVVVTPVVERRHLQLGRVALKSVSEKYLLRKGGTEFS